MSDTERWHGKRWAEWSLQKKILAICGGIVAVAGLIVLCGYIFMWLWNGLMPRIFNLPAISYWQGWGLVVLSSMLFKGTSHRGGSVQERRRKHLIRERMREQGTEEKAE